MVNLAEELNSGSRKVESIISKSQTSIERIAGDESRLVDLTLAGGEHSYHSIS